MIRFLQTPGKAKKIVLGGLLLIICAAMVITLVPGGILGDAFGYGGSPNSVAKVGDQEITVQEVDQLARQLGRQQFPKGFPAQFLPFMRQRAADMLILQKALVTEAQRMGFTATDDELREALRRIPELFPNGQFVGQEAYENFIVQNTNLSVPEFERRMKQDLLINKLRNAVEAGLSVTDAEIQKQYRRENTKVKFQYAVLTLDKIKKEIQPTEKELREFYDKNKQQYVNSIPERRKAEYVVIDTTKLREQVQVTPEELQRYYAQHQDEYRVPERVLVRHILIKTPAPGPDGKVDEKAVDAARQKAESLLAQIKKGANFAELAKKNSEDPGSKEEGGSLGWIQRGRTVPEFEQSAFSLPKGETSGVIRTTYGFHILRVEDKQQAHLKPLEEVKAQIEPVIASQKAGDRAESLARTVQTQARTSSLEQAAKQHGLTVVTSGLFTRTDTLPGLGSPPELMNAIFGAGERARAEMVSTPQGYAIFNVLEVKPPSTPSFEEAKSRVEEDFKNQRADQMLAQKTQQLSDQARSAHDLKQAAKAVGAEVKTSDLVGPNSQVPEIGSMSGPAEVAFEMKAGEISGPIHTGRAGVVLALVEKQEPPAEQLAASRDRIRDTLLQQKRGEYMELFVSNLRDRMEKEGKIRINQQVMNQIAKPAGQAAGD